MKADSATIANGNGNAGASKPRVWRGELREQFVLGLPVLVATSASVILWFATFVVLGRLGTKTLAGSSLGMSVTNLFANVVTYGVGSALDILFTQANGAGEKGTMIIVLHRGMIILSIICCFLGALLYHGDKFLLLLRQEPELAQIGGVFMRWWCLSVWPLTMFDSLRRFYQSQSRLAAVVTTSVLGFAFNIVANAFFVGLLRLDLNGASLSLALSYWTMFISLFAYATYDNYSNPNWWRLSGDVWKQWSDFLLLAFPSFLMLFFEWGSFEVTILMVSFLGADAIAEQAILMNMAYFVYALPAALSTIAVVRVGNKLGEADAWGARRSANVVTLLSIVVGTMCGALLFATRAFWVRLYTKDENLAEMTIKIAWLLSVFEATDNLQTTLGCVFKGSGRPVFGAIATLFAFWLVCIPLGAFFVHRWRDVSGVWTGYVLGEAALIVLYVAVLRATHWQEQVNRALELVDRQRGDSRDIETFGAADEHERLIALDSPPSTAASPNARGEQSHLP